MIDERPTRSTRLPRYLLRGDALEYGASLGNAHSWLTTRGSGSMQCLFNTDIGQIVAGSMNIQYGGTGHYLLRASAEQVSSAGRDDVQLRPISPGTTEIHPAFQRRRFSLPEDMQVQETVFLPITGDDDPTLAYYMVEVANDGPRVRSVTINAFARLGGTFASDISARYDPERRALVACDRGEPNLVRVFGCTAPVAAYQTSLDYGGAYDIFHTAQLSGATDAHGDILGALQVALTLLPGERRALCFKLAFSHAGEESALAVYGDAGDGEAALERTIEYLARATGVAQVLTPDATINQGVLWSKVNMLRVMAHYPQGPAFTNEPGVSSNVVGRDAAWFVYGNDHFLPAFSRALLDAFARLQHPSGKIVEYYSAVDAHTDDYGLNVNDDTPLFILAVNHHYRATGDLEWLRGVYPAVARAARYLLDQRDDRGLIYCSAQDPRGNVWAIAGWRNVIPDYSLNGAVTEINAECVAALRAAGHLAENLGRPDGEARAFFDASDALRRAMDAHLINPRNGLYYLALDARGIARTDVTGDQVFPVIFRACPDDVGFRIIRRLNLPDFWTSAGLRTASADDPLYDPARNVGLIGGVWPGLTWWFAFAAARYHPELMVQALKASFSHYAADPRTNNTVPGQFSEWFDGESLVNRGMRLSPWEPPRFLWAAVEGVCGMILQPDRPRVQPLVPAGWRWVALRRLPYHGAEFSFIATRQEPGPGGGFRIYATTELTTDYELEIFAEDVTELVTVLEPDVCHVALRRPDTIILLLGHTGAVTAIVPLDLSGLLDPDARYAVRLYDSEAYAWREGSTAPSADLCQCAVTIEAGGFRILTYEMT